MGQGEDFDAKPALFPAEAARRVVDLPDPALRSELRWLAGVTHTPVVRADGSILDTPGYDPATPPPYKLIVFDAPQQGTGKTLLAELGRILHGGAVCGSPHGRGSTSAAGVCSTPSSQTRRAPP